MNDTYSRRLIRIVHVDDDESFLLILKQFLDKISPRTYDIKSFSSPNEAFFEINSNPELFDIIISDFEMPFLNGLELYHKFSESNINIPFIFLTGSNDTEIPCKALNSGVKFFLRKENDIPSLLKQLDQLIKITVSQIRSQSEIESDILMLTDFISLLTESYENINTEVYSQILFKKILESFITVSDSEYGFICEVQSQNDYDYVLSNYFLTSLEWSSLNGYTFEVFVEENFPFKNLKRLYQTILIEKNPIIENNLQTTYDDYLITSSNRETIMKSFMGIPIFFQTKLVGILGLLNKPDKYSEQLVFKLQPFCLNLANFIHLKMYIMNLNEKLALQKQT